jgi:hypothetical protein
MLKDIRTHGKAGDVWIEYAFPVDFQYEWKIPS